jgi:hypothetical protein
MPWPVLGSPKEPGTDRGVPFKELTIGTQRAQRKAGRLGNGT